MKIEKVKKLEPNIKDKKTFLCTTHQKPESSIKAWFEIKVGT